MDGHYIEICRADDVIIGLTDTLIQLLRPVSVGGGEQSFPLLVLLGGTEMYVDDLGDGRAELAISHPDPTQRRRCAQWIYDTLFEQTPWALRWTADDMPVVVLTAPARPGHSSASPRHRLMSQAG